MPYACLLLPLVPLVASVVLAGCDGKPPVNAAPVSCLDGGAITSQCALTCPAGQFCWDFHAHDPTCSGTICTVPCCSNQDCLDAYSNNPYAAQATCGQDHLCDVVSLAIGSFACE